MSNDHPPPRLIDPVSVVIAGHRNEFALVDEALDHDDPAVRSAALGAMARMERLDHQRLRSALRDPDAAVRHRALGLVARHHNGRALIDDVLAAFDLDDRSAELAAFVLGELEDARPPVVVTLERHALHHDDALVRESAVAALGALHAGLETILTALSDKATVRRRAVLALAPFEGPAVDAALTAALDDRDWQVRQAAEDLLRPYHDDDAMIVDETLHDDP